MDKGKKHKKVQKYSAVLELKNVDWEKVQDIFSADRIFISKNLAKKDILTPRVREMLPVLAGGAVIALSFMFPALPVALAPLVIDRNKFQKGALDQTIKRLSKQKLVEIVYEKEMTCVKITDRGRMRALRYKLDDIYVKKSKVWDRKWRMVIFDIPEKYKRMREIFRLHLKKMGFYPIQKSVWIHPYPCFNEIEFLRQIYRIDSDVSYVLAEKIEDSTHLKNHFQLT